MRFCRNTDVEIRDVNKGTTESTKTDRDGVYRFFFLSPSQYTLTVAHDRFRKESRSVTVLLGTPVTVNITLEVAKANTQLSVTAEAPLVQADNGDVSTTMSQTQVAELPNPGNDLTYIAQTADEAQKVLHARPGERIELSYDIVPQQTEWFHHPQERVKARTQLVCSLTPPQLCRRRAPLRPACGRGLTAST